MQNTSMLCVLFRDSVFKVFFTRVTSKLMPKLFRQSSVMCFFNVFFLGGGEPLFFKSENCN